MRKRSAKTTVKSTEAIAETAAKVKETVKTAAKKVEASAPAEKTAEVVKEVVNKAPEVVQKAEKTVKTATKTATKTVRKAAGVRVKEVSLEIFETNVSMKDVASLKLAADGQVIIKGAQGITGTPKTATFTIGIILVLLTLFIVLNIINSRTGRAIMAIRDNRIAAESVGINITKYKLMAFTISASLAGVAGVLYAHNLATLAATPKSFGYNMSIMILVFVVLGGIGNIRGSMIAAVILTLLPEMLRSLNNYRMLIYAVVLIVMMLLTSSPKAIEVRGRIFSSFRKKKTEGEA